MDSRPVGIFNEENRRPTNTVWIYPFVGVVVTFVIFAIVASQTAGPAGIASINLLGSSHCGIDSDVLDKKLKIRVDERSCKHFSEDFEERMACHGAAICVKSCPQGSFDASTCTSWSFQDHKDRLLCQADNIKDSINSCNELQSAVREKQCVAWYEDTYELFGNCLSRKTTQTDDVDIQAIEANFGQKMLSLLPSFVYSVVIAGIVSIFFALTLKWSAAFVFWGFVLLIIIGMVTLIIVTAVAGTRYNDLNEYLRPSKDEMNAIYVQVGMLSFVLLIFLVVLYFLRNKIHCGIEIVKEASRCVCASFGSILFPFLPFLLRAGVIITACYISVMAITLRDNTYKVSGRLAGADCICNNNRLYVDGQMCTPEAFNTDCRSSNGGICTHTVCKLSDQMESNLAEPFVIVTICIAIWIVAFIQANAKMVLAHVYGNWYWNWNRQFIPNGAIGTAMTTILTKHTGTAAFGGFVVMVCRVLKSLLSKRQRGGCSIVGAIFAGILRFFAQAFLELVEFVSDKAFVVCAIMGYGFWDSVKTVSRVMVGDIPLVVATNWVGDIILFVCKFLAALASAGLFYFSSPFKGEDSYVTIIGAIVIFFFAFDLAAVLLTAYNVAIDTLLICTLQDFAHSGQEKAYFKSATLNGLLLSQKKDMV